MSAPVADAPLDTDRVSHSADVAEPGADWLRAVARHVRERLACDDLEWQRGEAWAFEQAIGSGLVLRRQQPGNEPHGATNARPRHGRGAARMINDQRRRREPQNR
jgi:hypothetical protein